MADVIRLEVGMASGSSRQDVFDFLDFLSSKGMMKRSTVTSRKVAVNTLLSILDEEEAEDVTGLDIDGLIARFSNLKGQGFKTASLRVYKSRLNSVLSDFDAYRRDPLHFNPQVIGKNKKPQSGRERDPSQILG